MRCSCTRTAKPPRFHPMDTRGLRLSASSNDSGYRCNIGQGNKHSDEDRVRGRLEPEWAIYLRGRPLFGGPFWVSTNRDRGGHGKVSRYREVSRRHLALAILDSLHGSAVLSRHAHSLKASRVRVAGRASTVVRRSVAVCFAWTLTVPLPGSYRHGHTPWTRVTVPNARSRCWWNPDSRGLRRSGRRPILFLRPSPGRGAMFLGLLLQDRRSETVCGLVDRDDHVRLGDSCGTRGTD